MTTHRVHAHAPRGDAAPLDRTSDAGRLAAHLEDAAHVPGGHAPALVVPRTERDVAAVLTGSPRVLAIGAQSSLTGGATPRGEVLLSTERLRGLDDLPDGRLRVGAGVTMAEIDAWLLRRGALYPPAPTWAGATVGGTIATNAAGAATFKYGATRAWVDELTIVLPTGDVLDLRRGEVVAHQDGYFEVVLRRGTVRVPLPRYRMPDVAKLSAGYYAAPGMDLIDLFIGSEGTLGVVTEATLAVEPRRPAVCLLFTTFRERTAALRCVGRLRDEARATWQSHVRDGLDVSAIEQMDARSLALLREDGVDRRHGVPLAHDAAMGLLIALDLPHGTTSSEVYDALAGAAGRSPLARVAALLGEFGAGDDTIVAAPGDSGAVARLLAVREAVPLAVNQRVGAVATSVDSRVEKTAADVIVPFDRLNELLVGIDAEFAGRGLDGAVWGHVSDGNVHANVIPRSFADVESGRDAVLAIGRAVMALGGAPLAEHGVGRSPVKQQLLRELYGDDGIDQMRAVKRALDPQGVLAPGVVFPSGVRPRGQTSGSDPIQRMGDERRGDTRGC